MNRGFVLIGIGILLGALIAGGLGAALGLVGGVAAGGLWLLLEGLAARPAAAGPLWGIARHRLICIPNGQPAECVLERDTSTGRWVDVHSCSLCSPANEVRCEKCCLRLMNDAKVV